MQEAVLSSSEEGSSLDEPSWVSWFCMLRNHEFFCEVDPAFVQDRFNLYGLKEVVGPLYGEAMTTAANKSQPKVVEATKEAGDFFATKMACLERCGVPAEKRWSAFNSPHWGHWADVKQPTFVVGGLDDQALFLSAPMLYYNLMVIMLIDPVRVWHHHTVRITTTAIF